MGVKRRQKGDMVVHRIKGYGRMSTPVVALRGQNEDAVDTEKRVA